MTKTITVIHKMLQEDKLVPIRVTYSVAKENENVTVYSCHITEDEVREWVGPQKFDIRVIFSPGEFGDPGVTITELSTIPIKTAEMGTFVNETATTIRVNEINAMKTAG